VLNTLFLIANIVSLPFWFVLIVFPKRDFTKRLFGSGYGHVGFVILGALYLFLLVGALVTGLGQGGVDLGGLFTADGLAKLLSAPAAAVTIWVHALAMDLAGAYYIYSQSEKLKMPGWALSLNLLLTLFLAPLGIFVFALGRILVGMAAPKPEKLTVIQQAESSGALNA
jgi:hypothetical protein